MPSLLSRRGFHNRISLGFHICGAQRAYNPELCGSLRHLESPGGVCLLKRVTSIHSPSTSNSKIALL